MKLQGHSVLLDSLASSPKIKKNLFSIQKYIGKSLVGGGVGEMLL